MGFYKTPNPNYFRGLYRGAGIPPPPAGGGGDFSDLVNNAKFILNFESQGANDETGNFSLTWAVTTDQSLGVYPNSNPAFGDNARFTSSSTTKITIGNLVSGSNDLLPRYGTPFTYCGWFYLSSLPSDAVIFDESSTVGGTKGFLVLVDSSQGLHFTFFNGSTGIADNAPVLSTSLVTGQWYFLSSTYDGVDTIYRGVDGNVVSYPIPTTINSSHQNGTNVLGLRGNNTFIYHGYMDSLLFTNTYHETQFASNFDIADLPSSWS